MGSVRLTVGALLAMVAVACTSSPALAVEIGEPPRTCETYPLAPDGSRRQEFRDVTVTDQVAATPPRVVTQLDRGERSVFCVAFQNRTGEPIDFELSIENVGADDKGYPATFQGDIDFGAASWISTSTDEIRDLPHGDRAWIEIDAAVPSDAVTGSSYAAIVATTKPSGESSGNQVQAIPSLAIQIVFDVPGNVDLSGSVRNIRSPRVIWWDGIGVSKLPVFDDLRGLGIAPIRMTWKNEGNATNIVGGQVVITSDFGGKTVATLPITKRVILRGAEFPLSTTWSKDIPLVGKFTPTLHLTDQSGVTKKTKLDPIWVIPAWWYLLLVLLAIALPVWWRRRSRQRYEDLLARVEAAESQSVGDDVDGDGDDWDDPSERW